MNQTFIPTRRQLIGLSGRIGSGKTTVTQYVIDNMPEFAFVEKSFAYNLKLITSIVCGLPLEDMFTHEGKNTKLPMYDGITVGELLQKIGTDLFRNQFDREVWVKSVFALAARCDDNWIISDVRFPNEADAILKNGGMLIRLEGDPMNARKESARDMSHPSETALDDYDRFNYILHTEPGEPGQAKLRELVSMLRAFFYVVETTNEYNVPFKIEI